MMKRLVCIALLFAILVLAHAGPNRGGGGPPPNRGGGGPPPNRGGGGGPPSYRGGSGGNRRPGYGGQWLSNICKNNTVAQQFPATVQAVISTLQSNGSFTAVLAAKAQEIAYVTNSINTALISTNCTAYFIGLEAAQAADEAAQEAAQDFFEIAGDLLRQAIASLLGRSSS